jgi:hypothetical protein
LRAVLLAGLGMKMPGRPGIPWVKTRVFLLTKIDIFKTVRSKW